LSNKSIFHVFSLIFQIIAHELFLISIHFLESKSYIKFHSLFVIQEFVTFHAILSNNQFLSLKISIGSLASSSLIIHQIVDQIIDLICGIGA
jgi:hypothetical protein